MRVLAIETVDTTGSVAVLDRGRLILERALDANHRSAQSLAPAIAALLSDVAWRPTDVQLVAVASGPGSFTGLRIGVTTAKTFAYASGCEVIDVHTLQAIAARVGDDINRLSVVLDAQRRELFVGEFIRGADMQLREAAATRIVGHDRWLDSLAAGSVVTGTGLARIAERIPSDVVVAERSLWAPTAGSVGIVGWQRYSAGERTDVFGLVPRYVRRAAAEEKRDRDA
jgi:tRNA threonylcarbamoyladenosine biosynthesis protein TsaB